MDDASQQYLLHTQYKDASNLNARVALHQRFSTNKTPWSRWVFDQIKLPERARVLEVGCGPAGLWRANRERIPAGWDVTLSDFSPGMLDEARAALGPQQHRFRFAQLDVQSIPYADHAFDGVIANHMLYHAPDLDRALAEIARALRPTGALYAATNGAAHLREMNVLLARVAPAVTAHWEREIRPTASFTLENGAAALARHFAVVRQRRYESALDVTEAEPLLAYYRSMLLGRMLDADQFDHLRALIVQELADHGALHITTATGLFQALTAE